MIALLLAASLVAAPDPGFDEIVHRVGQQPHELSVNQMRAWVAAHPQDPNAGRGLVWMAELLLTDRDIDDAKPLFERAAREYPNTEWGWQGTKGLADLNVAQHHYTEAIAAFDQLAALPNDYWKYVGRMSSISAHQEQLRWYIFLALTAALIIGIAVRLARARGSLRPLPDEVIYALPIAAVMLAAALAQPREEAHAVTTVAIGALVILYAHGVHLRAHASKPARIVEAVVGLCEAGALLYCAVVANDLWGKFAETLTSGAER